MKCNPEKYKGIYLGRDIGTKIQRERDTSNAKTDLGVRVHSNGLAGREKNNAVLDSAYRDFMSYSRERVIAFCVKLNHCN